ncbi:hypothetical protein M3J09_012982 [Ascochyta lentis]
MRLPGKPHCDALPHTVSLRITILRAKEPPRPALRTTQILRGTAMERITATSPAT